MSPKSAVIPGVIHRKSARHANDVARRLAAVVPHAIFFDGIRMKRMRHGNFEIAHFLRAALAHRAGFFPEAFAFDPQAGLENGHDFRPVLASPAQQIAHVIAVRVRQEDRVQPRQFLQRSRADGIRHNPRINQRLFPVGVVSEKVLWPKYVMRLPLVSSINRL